MGAQHSTEDLVAEADTTESKRRSFAPQLAQQVEKLEDPFVVPVGVVHAPRDQDGSRISGDLVRRRDVAAVFRWIFDHVVRVRFDTEGWSVL